MPCSLIRERTCLEFIYMYIYRVDDKIVDLKKTTLQLYFKTFIEKINSGNLIMY